MVCFEDREEEVRKYYRDEDASSVLDISWGARLWLGVTGTYRYAIVDALDPTRNKLCHPISQSI